MLRVPSALLERFDAKVHAPFLAASQRLIGACTPMNLTTERERLTALAAQGQFEAPRFEYRPIEDVRFVVAAGAHDLWKQRCDELNVEADLLQRRGTTAFDARARWQGTTPAADALAEHWLRLPLPPAESAHCRSDGPEADSLTSQLRRALRHTSYQVVPHTNMHALAATGYGTLYVAQGQKLTESDVARTVLHEVFGHAMPRIRALESGLALAVLGSAQGAETQEGYALYLEAKHGHMTVPRQRSLALRHLGACRMFAGATFVETVQWLCMHALPRDAVSLACRLYRGSARGEHAGLGREIAYLPYFVQVRTVIAEGDATTATQREQRFEVGQLSIQAHDALRDSIESLNH